MRVDDPMPKTPFEQGYDCPWDGNPYEKGTEQAKEFVRGQGARLDDEDDHFDDYDDDPDPLAELVWEAEEGIKKQEGG